MDKLIAGKGSFSLLSITKGGTDSGFAVCCENCGRVILNHARITDGATVYTVGTDCAKTLCDEPGRKSAKGFELWQKRIEFYTNQDASIIFRKKQGVPAHWVEVLQPIGGGKFLSIDWLKDHHGTFPASMLSAV